MKIIRHIVTASLLTFAVVAVASIQEPGLRGLEDDPEYIALKQQKADLQERIDSLQRLADIARQSMRQTDSLLVENPVPDTISGYILYLEQQVFDLRNEQGKIVAIINIKEQEWLIDQMFNSDSAASTDTTSDVDTLYADNGDIVADSLAENLEIDSLEQLAREVVVEPTTLIESPYIVNNLSAEDMEQLRSAIDQELRLRSMAEEYVATYELMRTTASAYRTVDVESEANSLFEQFTELTERTEQLSTDIDRSWTRVLDTKYYSYGCVLEHERRYDMLDSVELSFASMIQACAAEDGLYASDALMHYVIGYPALIDYEITFADYMGHSSIADTLRLEREQLQMPDYRIDPITLERRLFIDYRPITIGRTNFYNSNNPLPELEVYERGTIYRILLGEFRNRQPMTLFKGVQPLYIDQNEEGRYIYYTGGFETRTEADEAQLFLREKGFRNPEICRWRDGAMVNLSAHEQESGEEGQTTTVVAGDRYVVILDIDTLSDEVRATIQSIAPDKMISRSGSRFVVGTFTERSEADMLLSTLADTHPTISVSINQIEL